MTFIDSVGVNTHLGYTNTGYESSENFTRYSKLLGDSGVKHIRDGLLQTTGRSPILAGRVRALHRDYGIKTLLHIGNPTKQTQPFLDFIKAENLVPCLSGLEGVNEWDGQQKWRWVKGGVDRAAVISEIRNHQADLYKRVKADPALKHLPVIGASTGPGLPWNGSESLVGDLSPWLDYGNRHPYPGGKSPEAIDSDQLTKARVNSKAKPVMYTEHGYHNAVRTTGTHPPATEAQTATFLPVVYKDCYAKGIARTYWYELINHKTPDLAQQEHNFGLLRHDLSRKPAYDALKAMLASTPAPVPVSMTIKCPNCGQTYKSI